MICRIHYVWSSTYLHQVESEEPYVVFMISPYSVLILNIAKCHNSIPYFYKKKLVLDAVGMRNECMYKAMSKMKLERLPPILQKSYRYTSLSYIQKRKFTVRYRWLFLHALEPNLFRGSPRPINDVLQLLQRQENQDGGWLQTGERRHPAFEHEHRAFCAKGCFNHS